VERVPEWQAHLQQLADRDFFQGHLTGTQPHTHLMEQAAQGFRATAAYAAHRAIAQKPAKRILELARRPFDPSKVPRWSSAVDISQEMGKEGGGGGGGRWRRISTHGTLRVRGLTEGGGRERGWTSAEALLPCSLGLFHGRVAGVSDCAGPLLV